MDLGILPQRVVNGIDFFERKGLWFAFSKNPPVRSCAEAARQRSRLGTIGIPLCDELKTNVGVVDGGERPQRLVAVHTRGHQRIDSDSLARYLGGRFSRVPEGELNRSIGLTYGSVNPVELEERAEVEHVVDSSVFARFFPPYTMMTNLGDLEFGVEFYPQELFRSLTRVCVANIVRSVDSYVPNEPVFGLLTGNSPESGMLLWQLMNERIRRDARVRFRGDISFPRIVVESVPEMGLSMELQQRSSTVRSVVLDGVERLCDAGVNYVAIACNTTQFFADEVRRLCASRGVEFLSIVDETAGFIRSAGITEFDFLGIGAVSDFSTWSDFRRIVEEFDVKLPTLREIEGISELAFSVKRHVVTNSAINRLRDLINRSARTDTVVLALTELSILFATERPRQRSTRLYIDTLTILGERLAELYLGERLKSGAA